ncbi:hypothetical protein V5O48_012096 [Marasmius crinis-equi]|uniref:Sulfotransferase n=1 Tax=Marasmius crinis-equi TaxID=585013 RepID=A0ABR3F3Q1_9AGAR
MSAQHRRVYIFSHPRSTSHLFYQILSTHPAIQATECNKCVSTYRFGVDRQMPSLRMEAWLEAFGLSHQEAAMQSGYQAFLDEMQREAADAEAKDKCFLAADHIHHITTSSFINTHLNLPGRETRPTPVIVDNMLDVTHASGTQVGNDAPSELNDSNPTLLPDRFLFSLTPIITIRHPARTTPSHLRAYQVLGLDTSGPDFPVVASFKLERMLFDAFKSRAEKEKAGSVIVIDGDKLVKDPQGQMKKVCELLGLDEAQIKYSWDKPTMGDGKKLASAFLTTVNGSNGVILNPKYDKPVVIEEEIKGWAQEWDESTAKVLEELVRSAMPDYEYLLQHSL